MSFRETGQGTEVCYRADFSFVFPVSLVAPVMMRGRLQRLADETVAQLERSLLSL